MMNLFDKVKVVCALVVMGLGLAAYSAAPTVTSVTAQQRYPWNGLVDIVVTFNGAESDVAKANCTFAATNSATKTALAMAHVTQQGNDTGSGTTWTRRFIWDTNADLGEVKIDDVELVVDVETVSEEPEGLGGVQLWEGGPYWAECNVGASKPEEYGLYFWWGDTVGHAGDWYFDAEHCPTCNKSESELRSLGYIDSTGNLVPAHDAASKHLGAPWRMPTEAELKALSSNCGKEWMTRNGVIGVFVKGRGAYSSKSIFLPSAGRGYDSCLYSLGSDGDYWSSTYSGYCAAWFLGFSFSSNIFCQGYYTRDGGQSVRPVRGFASLLHISYLVYLALDNRTGMRVANAMERICFSPAWETDAVGATAVVSTNGVAVKSATAAGAFDWTPAQNGTYQLTHAVYVNGVQVGETLTATFLDEGNRRTVNCSFLAQQGEPQDEFDVTKAFAVLYKKVNGQYVEISRSGRQSQTFTVGDGTYRIEFQYADDTWVAANYSTELTVSQDSPGWAMEVEGRYIKAADTWALWVRLYANEGDDSPYEDRRYRGDARNWDEISSISFDPNIDIPLSDLNWPLWALQSEEEVEWYEYDVINRKAGSRMPVGRVAGRRCITVWEKDVPYNVLRLVAKKKKVKKTVEIKFYKWEWELFSFWAFAPEGTTTGAYVSPAIRDGERTEESFTVEDCEGISFVWKTSCEDAAIEGPHRDHGEFLVDGKVVATRAGESDWSRVSIDFEDTGSHTITWRYVKDASGSSGDDCMWVSCINVEPIAAENPELAIETEQLPSVMEMEEYEEQLECSGGTEPYWWSMDEADYLAVAEESTFAEVGEAQGWRKNDGEWVYDLPFAFNFGGRVYDSVVVNDNACLYFAMGSNTDAIETSLGDLYSESADQDIFVERASDHVTFRWKRVLYSDRESEVNCSITLNADGTIRCAFGDSSYESRQVWLSTARDGAEAEQFGDDDIVFEPNYLPLGLWLEEETGLVYGAPEQAGHYAFDVYVSDGEGAISSKRVTLDVEANPNDHSSGYRIVFDARDGAGAMSVQIVQSACVYKLPKCTLKPPEGKTRFAGWAGSNGRRYDDEMLVFNLAQPGETVTMTAIWDGEGGQQKELGGVQLWEGGPYWAECNVGATKPEECGYYFWWGDTVGYKRNANNNGWISVKDSTKFSFVGGNCSTNDKGDSQLLSEGYIDASGNLGAVHDAATAHLGSPWRMPTDAEFSALINNCTTTWTTRNGVFGRLVTGKGVYSSKRIFLPAAGYGDDSSLTYLGSDGYYWSSTSYSDYSLYAWFLDFSSGYFCRLYNCRFLGQSVRPVRGFAK